MTAEALLLSIPGGPALIDWFGRVHRFHDAKLLEINLSGNGLSRLRIHTWRMTDKADSQGYFILDKHLLVTISLEQVSYVALTDFNLPGIIFDLETTKAEDAFQLFWTGSHGIEGTLRAKNVALELQPGAP